MNEPTRQIMNQKPVFHVPAKTVINFDSGFGKKLLCDGPVFNAGQACVYNCQFCYVESMQRKQRMWFEKHGLPNDYKHMDVVIRNADAVKIAREQLESYPEIERRKQKVIYSSTKVDVAGNMELVRETVEICKVILELTNWDIRLLSKSNLLPQIAKQLEIEFLNGRIPESPNPVRRIIYGVSTGTLDDKLATAFEEGTPLVSKRIESLHLLQDNGFRTFGMICPSLPQVPTTAISEHESYLRFADKMCEAIRGDRCEHVWAEVINVRGESFKRTEKALGDAGYHQEAAYLNQVSHNKDSWEAYARATFEAHAQFYEPGKLRFLQYVTKDSEPYWRSQVERGAVLL